MKPTRIFDILPYQLENFPQETAVAAKVDGVYKGYSSQYFLDEANAISKGLLKLGIKRNDKVALVSWNCPQWLFADYGIQHLGAVGVPMYPTITKKITHTFYKMLTLKLYLFKTKTFIKRSLLL